MPNCGMSCEKCRRSVRCTRVSHVDRVGKICERIVGKTQGRVRLILLHRAHTSFIVICFGGCCLFHCKIRCIPSAPVLMPWRSTLNSAGEKKLSKSLRRRVVLSSSHHIPSFAPFALQLNTQQTAMAYGDFASPGKFPWLQPHLPFFFLFFGVFS